MGRSPTSRLLRLSAAVGLVGLTATGCTLAEVEDKLRFGWPRGITEQAERMRVLWTWSTVAALVVGAIVWGLIFWSIVVYRKRSDELPKQTKLNMPIEAVYTILPILIVCVLFYYTVVAQNFVDNQTDDPDVTVEVVAKKWNWEFHYLDRENPDSPDGVDPVNTVGTSNEIPILVLPVGQNVRIHERSLDVVHSFWVPEFLFKRDVIPSVDNSFEITIKPGQEGAYVGRCAELCGTYHSMMNFEVRAVSPEDYERYLDALADLGNDPDRQARALESIGQDPLATTTHPFDTDRTEGAASERGD